MKYSRLEELPVWNDAIELSVRVFTLTALPVFRRYASVRDQIERASMSISNNVAEGFERGTTQETLTFLYIARGSSGETRSVLYLCERLPGSRRSQIGDLRSQNDGGENFATTASLVRVTAKLRYSRTAIPDEQIQK